MTFYACEPDDIAPLARSVLPDLLVRFTAVVGLATATAAVIGGLLFGTGDERSPVATEFATMGQRGAPPTAVWSDELLSPAAFGTRTAFLFGQSGPLRAALQRPEPPVIVTSAPVSSDVAPPREFFGPAWMPPLVEMADAETGVPLPLPRPAEFGSRPLSKRLAAAPVVPGPDDAPPAKDGGGLFERLFGSPQPSGPALAYANPQDGLGMPKERLAAAPLRDNGTAIYDISAKTVFMPDGTRLEAHSGLREMLDDPRNVHLRMRGATPPATYDLRLRERLFHGVQAIRLTPIDSNVHGRTGLLAHTYMLGPNGDSNGCVSFRDYNAFLQAYLAGKIKRLTVVARMN